MNDQPEETEEMMTDSNDKPRLNGCGWAVLAVVVPIVLAFVAAALYILFNIGAWIGGQ